MQWQTTTYAGGWFVFAVINSFLAAHKNRSSARWFFFGLLFGPLATLSLWFQPTLPPEND